MRTAIVALSLLASACVVEARPRPPPPPPPRMMSEPEAVAAATSFARSRGLVVDYTQNAWVDRHARWHVNLGGAGGRDHAAVVLDAFSGRVLSARLRGPRGDYAQPPPAGTPPEPPEPPPSGTPAPPPSAPPPPPAPPAG